MKRPVLKMVGVTAAIVAVGYAFQSASGGFIRGSDPVVVASASGSGATEHGSALHDIDRLIRDVDRQAAATPTSSGLDLLARLQLSRGRITGDAGSYANAMSAVDRSLAIAPDNLEARSLHAEVLYANHEFSLARDVSAAIVNEDPTQLGALAVYGDASRELGNFAEASRVLDDLNRSAPNAPSVTVRRSRLAFLSGDPERAAELAARADAQAQESGLLGPTLAFYDSFQGQLAHDRGDYRKAIARYRRALEVSPGDRTATLGLARSLAATGRLNDAAQMLGSLTDRYPDPSSLALYSDVLDAIGDTKHAADTRSLVDAVAGIARSNQQIYNRELALYYANHDTQIDEALRLSRGEITQRKDVYAYDTLAWVEYKAGHLEEAESAAATALAFGTKDAAIAYHAGMIALASGDVGRAAKLLETALSTSPVFDIRQAPLAQAALERTKSR